MRSVSQVIRAKGIGNIVYLDESGFDNRVSSTHGWAKKGKKLYREVTGKREARENLIAARRGQELLAPMITRGSVNAKSFEKWLEEWLFKELNPDSTLILDNSPIHRRWVIERMVAEAGHTVIFLPKYSPDFNKIEHDFAALKKRRANAPIDTPLDVIISDYAGRSAL